MSKVCPVHKTELQAKEVVGIMSYFCAGCAADSLDGLVSPATRRNIAVQNRYDELARLGKHGHYETMIQVVREQVEAAKAAIEKAMQVKHRQLIEYRATLADRTDDVGRHAYTIAEGRLLQLEADMALLSLQP